VHTIRAQLAHAGRRIARPRARMNVDTEIVIDAAAADVWTIQQNLRRYPEWNPYTPQVEGELRIGAPLRLRFAIWTGGLTVPASARVLSIVPEREARWAGHLLFDALLRAEHYHLIDPIAPERIRLRHGERFTGVLAVILAPLIALWAPGRYRAVNRALKQRAEHASVLEAA
jgi:hypothetical protein